MAKYTQITLAEMREVLRGAKGWHKAAVSAKEHVFDWPLPQYKGVVVRVYTSVNKATNTSRTVGTDAIRVCAVDTLANGGKGRGVIKTKRVHRVGGWRKNLQKRAVDVIKHAKEVMERREDKGKWPNADTVSPKESATPATTGKKPCDKCKGTGTYKWGTKIDGVITRSGSCNQCEGKGYMTPRDEKRTEEYWNRRMASENHSATAGYALKPEDIPTLNDEVPPSVEEVGHAVRYIPPSPHS